MNKYNYKSLILGVVSAAFLATNVLGLLAGQASAATFFTKTSVRESRMETATAAALEVVFTTSSAGGGTSLLVNMNGADGASSWTTLGGVVPASQTATSASCAATTGATALPGTLAAAGATGTITITGITTLAASTSYCVDITGSSVTNPTTAGQYHPTLTTMTGATTNDTTTVAVDVITNDQIAVTATVPPTFTIALSANADTFTAPLSSTSIISTNGVTATIGTNANYGWNLWASDSNVGLLSPSRAHTIASTTPGTNVPALTVGSEGYIFGVTAITQGTGAGVTSAATAYNATASGGINTTGSGLDTSVRQVASSTGSANGAVLTLKERAAIAATTPAAPDYGDTITLIGAGTF